MPKYTGNLLAVKVGATNLAELISCEINESAATYDTTIVGENAETHLPGKTNSQGTINFLDIDTGTSYAACVPGTLYAMEVYPQGNTSGKPKIAFSATITGRQRPVAHNAATPVTVTFSTTGVITHSTVV